MTEMNVLRVTTIADVKNMLIYNGFLAVPHQTFTNMTSLIPKNGVFLPLI